jgi:hypothetical protein
MAQAESPTRHSGEQQQKTLSDLDNLDVKALTTPMHALVEGPGIWLVMHTNEHYVSLVGGEFHCDCRGYQYGHECYHIRRLKYETGVYDIPAGVERDAICDQFREWTGPEDIPDSGAGDTGTADPSTAASSTRQHSA